MLHLPSRLALVAAIFYPAAACVDYTPPATSPSSSDNSASVEALETQLHAAQAKLAETQAEANADSTTPKPRTRTPTKGPGPSLPAFVSGGEQRLECPVGYHAQEADGVGCECASSTDGTTVPASRTEATCSNDGRAEADECIFTCPEKDQSTE
jgi:hypothetical protein